MDASKVVITQDREFIVVSFFNVPIYTDADSGANKFDEKDLSLVIVAPVDVRIVKVRDGKRIDATVLADDFDRFIGAEA